MSFAKIFPFPNVLVSLRLISKGVALVKITVLAVFISIKNGFPFLRLEIRLLDTRSFQNTFVFHSPPSSSLYLKYNIDIRSFIWNSKSSENSFLLSKSQTHWQQNLIWCEAICPTKNEHFVVVVREIMYWSRNLTLGISENDSQNKVCKNHFSRV